MRQDKLKDKNILFIGVKFYDYNHLIQKKIEEKGAKVTFFYERDISIKYAIVDTFFPKFLNRYQSFHYSSILNKVKDKHFDYIFVIRGHRMPVSFITTIKRMNPNIICIMYQWDANSRSPFTYLIPKFDKVYSFDFRDVEDNLTLKYLPLFYTDDINNTSLSSDIGKLPYDFFYFGSYLPERYVGLIKFKNYVESKGYTLKFHFYMSYKYYLKEIIKGSRLDRQLISFNIMKRKEYLYFLNNSNIIVDVSNEAQSGLSMRVIEALGAGKKILTTNKWIIKEACFDPTQVAVIDMDSIDILPSFLEMNTKPNPVDYSLNKWLEKVFCL